MGYGTIVLKIYLPCRSPKGHLHWNLHLRFLILLLKSERKINFFYYFSRRVGIVCVLDFIRLQGI